MLFNIHICTKNYKSLQNFVKTISKKSLLKLLSVTNSTYSIERKNKIFTVLKSPHVNKTAQEHFEQNFYSKKFKIYSYKPFLFLVFLKTLKQNHFTDLTFKIEVVNQPQKHKQILKNKINPDNFSVLRNTESLNNYLKILNNYGHLLLKN